MPLAGARLALETGTVTSRHNLWLEDEIALEEGTTCFLLRVLARARAHEALDLSSNPARRGVAAEVH